QQLPGTSCCDVLQRSRFHCFAQGCYLGQTRFVLQIRAVARTAIIPQGRACSREVAVGRLLSSRAVSSNSTGMAVARPVTRVLPVSFCVDLAGILPSFPIAATNRRCDISGIELMVAFHGFGVYCDRAAAVLTTRASSAAAAVSGTGCTP